MPIKIQRKTSNFSTQIRDFTANTLKLKAGITEYTQVTYEIELFWYAEPVSLQFFDDAKRIVRNDGRTFPKDGFSIGDIIQVQGGIFGSGLVYNFTCNVTGISEDGFTLFTDANEGSLNGIETGDGNEPLITGLSVLENLSYEFGLIENDENFNTDSKLTQENQKYNVQDILLNSPVNGVISGTKKGWSSNIGFLSAERKISTPLPVIRPTNFGSNGGTVPQTAVLNYEIVQRFPLLPYFLAGDFENLQNGISPSFLEGNNSLKHVFNCEFKKNISSTEGNKSIRIESLLGSVGNFGENFNGLQTQYSLQSIAYQSQLTTEANDSLFVSEITEVECVLLSANGTFTGNKNVIVSHSYLPQNEEEYLNSDNYFEENFIFESVAKGNSGTIIKNVTTTQISVNVLQVNFDIDLSSTSIVLDADSQYLLSIILDDTDITAEDSDRTPIILDLNNYTKNPDIPGLFEVTDFQNFDHLTSFSEVGNANYKGWVQDGFAVKGTFRVNRTLEALLNTFDVQIVAWKDNTEEYFVLQTTQFNVSNAIIDNDGNQQIFINESDGFQLKLDDEKNQKVLVTGAFAGDWIDYGFSTGLKIDWQEWLLLEGVDTIFYDVLEPNFGLNKDSSRYSLKEGYTLRTITKAVVSQNGIPTDYINRSLLEANEFGEIATQDWEMLPKYTEDESSNSLNGGINGNETTLIKIEFKPNFAITPDINDFEGIIRIEPILSQSRNEIYELSSVVDFPSNNLIIPLEGETLLKKSLNGNNIVLECRTNKQFTQDVKYNISGKLLSASAPIVLGDFNNDFDEDFYRIP